jgi:hypothetical protein
VFAHIEPGEQQELFTDHRIEAVFLLTQPSVRYGLGPRLAFEVKERGISVLHSHHLGPYLLRRDRHRSGSRPAHHH